MPDPGWSGRPKAWIVLDQGQCDEAWLSLVAVIEAGDSADPDSGRTADVSSGSNGIIGTCA